MLDPFTTMCLATMLFIEARGEPIRGQVANIQAALMRQAINKEYPQMNYFPGGTNLCAIVSADGWYAPKDMNLYENVKLEQIPRNIIRLVEFVLTHDLPWVAGGAPCFHIKRGVKDSIVIGQQEFNWRCTL